MHVEVGATMQQGIQIGRTVVILDISPQAEPPKEKQRLSEREVA